MSCFTRMICGGGFYSKIQLDVYEKKISIKVHSKSMGGNFHEFELLGECYNDDKYYKLVELDKIIIHHTTYELNIPNICEIDAWLDIYILPESARSDDSLIVTWIHNANCPRWPETFNCAIYLNDNVVMEPDFDETAISKLLKFISKIKLASTDSKVDEWIWSQSIPS